MEVVQLDECSPGAGALVQPQLPRGVAESLSQQHPKEIYELRTNSNLGSIFFSGRGIIFVFVMLMIQLNFLCHLVSCFLFFYTMLFPLLLLTLRRYSL